MIPGMLGKERKYEGEIYGEGLVLCPPEAACNWRACPEAATPYGEDGQGGYGERYEWLKHRHKRMMS